MSKRTTINGIIQAPTYSSSSTIRKNDNKEHPINKSQIIQAVTTRGPSIISYSSNKSIIAITANENRPPVTHIVATIICSGIDFKKCFFVCLLFILNISSKINLALLDLQTQ